MGQFTVRGEVLKFSSKQYNIRVQNADELREFWTAEGIDTNLDWNPSEIRLSFGAEEFRAACEIGDIVDYTIESCPRAGGRGIRGVALKVVTPAQRPTS